MSKVHIPAFQDISSRFNMDAVVDAIWLPREDGRKPNYGWDEFDNIKEMVWAAAEKWLARDMVEFNITGVEQLTTHTFGDVSIKAYMDVEATMRGTIKPFDEFAGKRIVVDWKTRDGELDQRWRQRLLDSWQYRIYAAMSDVAVFSYRGISRRCYEGDCGTKEILIAVPHSNYEETRGYVNGQLICIDGLIKSGIGIWPRSMPDACHKYDRDCPFLDDCNTYNIPSFTPLPGKVLSYSRLDDFNRCKEFYRRMLGNPEADDTESSLLGTGVHQALAELYRQATIIKL